VRSYLYGQELAQPVPDWMFCAAPPGHLVVPAGETGALPWTHDRMGQPAARGSRRNLAWVLLHTDAGAVGEEDLLLLADAQTSGGLLVAGNCLERQSSEN
jgi:hypothetical protein